MRLIFKHYKKIISIITVFLIFFLGVEDLEGPLTLVLSAYSVLLLYWGAQEFRSLLRLKKEKTKTELLHLKSQVNPHFFFNMLNNLYGLVEKDGKKAQALILKLSDMMRYSIYEGQKDWVTLEAEVEYLNNYMELHQMRYHKKIDLVFNVQIKQKELKVMPLLFIILLENAFKHGVENLRADAYVHLSLLTIGTAIHFTVENNFDGSQEEGTSGIGLKNLRRRLELVYPKKHVLSLSQQDEVYTAQLILKQ